MAKAPYIPARGDIISLNLDPRTGHEQSGWRPALIISPAPLTAHTRLAIICPITSKIKGLPFEIVLERTKTKGAVLPIHLRSVDVTARGAKLIEKAPRSITEKAFQAVQSLTGAD